MNTGQHDVPDTQAHVVRLKNPEYLQPMLQEMSFANFAKLPLLSEFPNLEAQQALLTKDVFYGLLGYEGSYFKFSDRYDQRLLHDRIIGPDHNVAKHIDVSLKTAVKRLLRYGKMYSGLLNFAMIYNMPVFGRANHRLCYEISTFLQSYRSLISSVQSDSHLGSCSLTAIDNAIQREAADKLSLLYEIACIIHTETEDRNPLFKTATDVVACISKDFAGRDPRFNTFLESIRNDIDSAGSYIGVSSDSNKFEVCKGGCVLKIVQNKIAQYNGDRVAFSFLLGLFEAISRDYVELLNLWLSRGEVNDPFQEFFIKKNELPRNIFYSNMERFWEELYVIKTDGLIDHFTTKDMQTKLLSAGKFLNIFRLSIGRASLQSLPEAVFSVPNPAPISSLSSKDLTFKINQFYARANKVLLRMLFKGYFFNDVLSALHRTCLLNDSFGIDNFLNASYHELGKAKKPATITYTVLTFDSLFPVEEAGVESPSYDKITSIIKLLSKFTVDASNFYDIAEEIINIKSFDTEEAMKENDNATNAIKKFVSQSLQRAPLGSGLKSGTDLAGTEGLPKSSDPVIEGVNIDVNLPFPLNLIIGENFIFEYQLIFRFQMILKFSNKLLDNCWKDISFSSVWNYKGHSQPTRKLMIRCRVLLFRMKSLLTELQSYLNYTIIDANFSALCQTADEFRRTAEAVTITEPKETTTQRLRLGNSIETHGMSLRPDDTHLNTSSQNEPHFFMKQDFTGNDIFDKKIQLSSQRQLTKSKAKKEYCEISELNNLIGKYLNNILRDSMITSGPLLKLLRSLLEIIHLFSFTVTRLKKTFILMNADLLQEYKVNYLDKFENIEYSETLMRNRLAGLNEVVTGYWSRFNESLGDFSSELRPLSGENASFLVLLDIFARV